MEKKQQQSSDLGLEVRLSQKVIRRDGTVEEIPGEWEAATEEEAVQQYGVLESFQRWLERKKEELNG